MEISILDCILEILVTHLLESIDLLIAVFNAHDINEKFTEIGYGG